MQIAINLRLIIKHYFTNFLDRQKKMLKNKALQKENKKLKQLEHQIERFCDGEG